MHGYQIDTTHGIVDCGSVLGARLEIVVFPSLDQK
jgi:hypothetical protein